ncbi:MAG: hypothetical protein LBU28_03445, partial [Spirochaetaceae bacterium]|nr:hypothetical protein [Spirochaetaceae bacterium]
MYKRSHVIGSIAVLMISFLVLMGCPTDAGTDEPGGTPGSETVPGGGGGGGGGGDPSEPVDY